jgi:hypothetical protein
MIYLIAGLVNFYIGYNTDGLHSTLSYILFAVCAIMYAIEQNRGPIEEKSEIETLLDNPKQLEKMVDEAIETMKEELKGTEQGQILLEMMDDPEAFEELRKATMESLIGELR